MTKFGHEMVPRFLSWNISPQTYQANSLHRLTDPSRLETFKIYEAFHFFRNKKEFYFYLKTA